MQLSADEIASIIKQQIQNYDRAAVVSETGTVLTTGDGIARVYGLEGVMAGELVEFPGEVYGLVLNLEQDNVGVAILGEATKVVEGDLVKRTGRIADVPVGEGLAGRIVNALGQPVDGKGPIDTKLTAASSSRPPASSVVSREGAPADGHQGDRRHDSDWSWSARAHHRRPPDGQDGRRARHHHQSEGQRRLLRLRGHRPEGVHRGPGGREAPPARRAGVHDDRPRQCRPRRRRCSTSRPYTGVTIAEYFRDTGRHALCIYDDLSKQAVAYRQMSLLLRRPPGREAYPGDVFYIHSRLLERAAKLAERWFVVAEGQEVPPGDAAFRGVDGKVHLARKRQARGAEGAQKLMALPVNTIKMDPYSGGSLTALPIIETQAGDVSAYIPTNVISITDGQIFLVSDLFNSGQRPAINVGISV